MRSVISLVFLCSGISSLIYQVVWQRVLTQIIGIDAISIAFIVAIFLAGLGIGSLAAARFVLNRSTRELILWYAAIEVLIGAYGLASVYLLRMVDAWVSTTWTLSLSSDFLVYLCALFPPTFLMGATSPIIIQATKQGIERLGQTVGWYYGLNIVGAAIGTLLTGLVLIELVGLPGSVAIAAGLNWLLALAVFFIPRQTFAKEPAVKFERWTPPPSGLILAAFLFGFATLTLQIVFIRIIANYFTLSPLTFPISLTAYLLLMAAGQYVGGRLVDRTRPDNYLTMMLGVFAAGSAILVAMMLIRPTWWLNIGAYVISPSFGFLSERKDTIAADPSVLTGSIFALVFMSSLIAFTSFFPMLTKLATKRIADAGSNFGTVLAASTLGNVFGAFITGLVLLKELGAIWTMIAAVIAVGGAIVLTTYALGTKLAKPLLATTAICAVVAATIPKNYWLRFSEGQFRVSDVIEGTTGVASVVPTNRFFTLIAMFRTESGVAMSKQPALTDNYQAWRLNASDIMALDPKFRPKKILVLGLGHAYMARTFLDYPFVEKLVIVELSKEISDSVPRHSYPEIAKLFNDPRVEIVLEDGRRYMKRALANHEKFDLIQVRINEPWRSGASSLFTLEMFETIRGILNENGYMAVRPMVNHIATALKVFPSGIWTNERAHAYFGRRIELPSEPIITADIKDSVFAAFPGDNTRDKDALRTLKVTQFQPTSFTSEPINTDNHPLLEYYTLRQKPGAWLNERLLLPLPNYPLPTTDLEFQRD